MGVHQHWTLVEAAQPRLYVVSGISQRTVGFQSGTGHHRPQPLDVGGSNPLGGEPQAHGAGEPTGMVENRGADGAHTLVPFTENCIKPLLAYNVRLLLSRNGRV